MTYVGGVISFLVLALWVYCLVDVVTTPKGQSRVFNKWIWLAVVAMLALVGAVAWLVFGRPRRVPAGVGGSEGKPASAGRTPSTPPPPTPPVRPRRPAVVAPDDDPDFLRRLEEIAELERRARDDDPPSTPS